MSNEETQQVFEELKKKYPGMTNESLAEIMTTGAERGIITVKPEPESSDAGTPGDPDFDIFKALKGGADLDEIMRFMVIDNWIKERFNKGKEIPTELKEALEKLKSGKKDAGDFDAFMDRMMKYEMMETFMDSRRARAHQQPQGNEPADLGKIIQEMGDKMTEALRTHKLEDEREKAEERVRAAVRRADEAEAKLELHRRNQEDDQRLEEKVKETMSPLEAKYEALLKDIGDRLKNVSPEAKKGLMLDLDQMITEELGEEIKGRIVEGIKSAFGEKDTSPVTTDASGKAQLDWYKFGERVLKTVEKFADKLPIQPPAKRDVKEIPRLPTAKPPSEASRIKESAEATPAQKKPPEEEASRQPHTTEAPGTSAPAQPTREPQPSTEPPATLVPKEKPLIPTPTKTETATEKNTSEQPDAEQRSQESGKTDQQQETKPTG